MVRRTSEEPARDPGRSEMDMSPTTTEEIGGFTGPQLLGGPSEIQPGMPLQPLTWLRHQIQYPDVLPQVKKFLGIPEEPNNQKGE